MGDHLSHDWFWTEVTRWQQVPYRYVSRPVRVCVVWRGRKFNFKKRFD